MSVLKTGKFNLLDPSIISVASWGNFVATVSAANDGFAYICQAPVTDTLASIKFWAATVTTGGTIDVRIETVDGTTGNPTGTLWAANTNASVTLGATSSENSATFTAAPSFNKGDVFAIVFRNPASLPPNYTVRTSGEILVYRFPYAVRQISGAWTKFASDLAVAANFTTNGYYELMSGRPIAAATTPSTLTNFNSGSNPKYFGNKFIAPGPLEVIGFCSRVTVANTSADYIYELFDSTNAVVLSYAVDATIRQSSAAGMERYEATSSYILHPGETYRVTARPTTVNNIQLDYIPHANSAYLSGDTGGGVWSATKSGDGITWTDTATDLIFLGLICDGLDIAKTPMLTQ